MRRSFLACTLLLIFAACEGDEGPQGVAGTDGADWPGPPPQEFLDADAIAGGAAYSKWWTTDAAGSGSQPSTSAPADFYRCKACHAWDGLGNAASYASRTGQSTLNPNRPDVSSINLRSTAASESHRELFDLIRHLGARTIDARDNTHPDFSMLTDDQVWNLVKFMKEEWVAPNVLYDLEVSGPAMYVDYTVDPPVVQAPTLTYSNVGAMGDEANGLTVIAAAGCTNSSCHGADGTSLDLEGRSLGQFVREKPNEAWHKMKFGEAGTGMSPGLVTETSDIQDVYRAFANATSFPDL